MPYIIQFLLYNPLLLSYCTMFCPSLINLLSSAFVLLIAVVSCERVSIQAGKSFCVFDDLKANVPWGIQFQSDEHEIRTVVIYKRRLPIDRHLF